MELEQVARSRPGTAGKAYDGDNGVVATIDLRDMPTLLPDAPVYREGLVPASGDELMARRGVRGASFTAKVAASVVAAVTAYLRLRDLRGSAFAGEDILLCLAPIVVVGCFDLLVVRGGWNPAADIIGAFRAAIVAIATLMVAVPVVTEGSGLYAGLAFAAVLVPARVILSALVRATVHRVSAPVRIVVLCSPDEDLQLRRDLSHHVNMPSTEVLSWHEVFPPQMSRFSESWLASAGKVWDPTDLLIVIRNQLIGSDEHLKVMSRLEDLGSRVCSLDSFYERYLGRTRVSRGESVLLLLQQHEGRSAYGGVKSVAEVLVAMIGLVVLVILGPAITVAIRATSRGSALYRQERVGLHGRRFTLLKFRTMRTDAERTGAQFALVHDARTTSVGRFLRRSRLDELPQMWNVLRREMSLVGPRPERPQFAAQLNALFPAYNKRLLVRPGITGWAQVNDAYAADIDDHRRKLERDLYYVRHRSPTLDLQILARTVRSIARMAGR